MDAQTIVELIGVLFLGAVSAYQTWKVRHLEKQRDSGFTLSLNYEQMFTINECLSSAMANTELDRIYFFVARNGVTPCRTYAVIQQRSGEHVEFFSYQNVNLDSHYQNKLL